MVKWFNTAGFDPAIFAGSNPARVANKKENKMKDVIYFLKKDDLKSLKIALLLIESEIIFRENRL